MSVDFGAGPALDEHWDFSVAPSGDLKIAYDIDELQKDVAFNLATELEQYLGTALTRGDLRDVQVTTVEVLGEDPRIDTVVTVDVIQTEINRLEVTIEVNTVVSNEPIDEFIVEVTS